MDPIANWNFGRSRLDEWDVYRSVHDKLFVTEGAYGGFEPVLAETWHVDEKSNELTIRLKDNIRFSNGREISANDVKFSLYRKLRLTSKTEPTFAICLGLNPEEMEKVVESDLDVFRVPDDRTIVIRLRKCGSGILEELSGTNFAIVAQEAVGPDLRLTESPIVSGMNTYEAWERGIILRPNRFNWRFTGSDIPDYQLVFDNEIDPREVDFQVTGDRDVASKLRERGLAEKASIFNTTAFLSSPSGNPIDNDLLRYFRKHISDEILASRMGNDFFQPAIGFFPKGYGCIEVDPPAMEQHSEFENASFVVRYAKESQLSNRIVEALKAALTYDVSQRTTFVGFGERLEIKERQTVFSLHGQHLSKRPSEVIRLVVQTFKNIPDPGDEVASMLVDFNESSKQSENKALDNLCRKFAWRHHAPLLHVRKIAFASDKAFLSMFSEVLGNIHYDRIYVD